MEPIHNGAMAKPRPSVDKPLVRGEPIVARVLGATMEEVALTGYDGLTLERVAARAGVNRTTIYRRWPTRKDLVGATIRFASDQVAFDWDRGDLREDLAELLRRARDTVFAPGMLGLHRLMMESTKEPSFQEIVRAAREQKRAQLLQMLARAERRGEVRADLDRELFLDGIFGTLFAKVVFENEPLTPALQRRLLEHFVRLAGPAPAPGQKGRLRAPAGGRRDRIARSAPGGARR